MEIFSYSAVIQKLCPLDSSNIPPVSKFIEETLVFLVISKYWIWTTSVNVPISTLYKPRREPDPFCNDALFKFVRIAIKI